VSVRLALAAAALVAAAPADGPEAYPVHVRVTAAPGVGLQRVELPAAILAGAASPGLTDLRLFDADGRALPLAPAAPTPGLRRVALAPLPIRAAAERMRVTALSVELDPAGRPRAATLAGTPGRGEAAATVGVLLDTRALGGAARRLQLTATLPAGQPVSVTVAASPDLRRWRTLGEAGGYAGDGTPVALTVPLGDAALARDWLRVMWTADTRLLGPVVVRGATLETAGDAPAAMEVTADAPEPVGGAVTFAVPFATPVISIAITPRGAQGAVPVRVLGRDADEEPWLPLGQGLAAVGRQVPLTGTAARVLRIEPLGGAGFAAAPAIRFGLEPRAVLFVGGGRRPYTLAAGRRGAPDFTLSRASLGVDGPPAAARAADPPVHLVLAAPDARDAQRRQALLWGVLLLATAALGWMAWRLWRGTRSGQAPMPPS